MRPVTPPGMEFFDAPRPVAGPHALTLRLGPLEIEIGGLDEAMAALLTKRYGPYASREPTDTPDALRVRLAFEDTEWFIQPLDRPELVQVRLACDGTRLRFLSYRVAGWFDAVGGRGDLLLARGGPYEPVERAIENYVRAAVAWQAVSRGGALVHAASAVWNGRGYLFYGESGAGKSTLSACNRRAQVVSDDLSLLLPDGDGRLDLVGSPFRGTYTGGPPVVGRFPLAAGFRLIQSPAAAVTQVPRVRGLAELVGNLPFVAEMFPARPDLFAHVQRAFAALPMAHLHFRKDDSYWDAIASAGY